MGHGKIALDERINHKKSRANAFYKRKFGVMRKLVQMSKMCDKEILLLIYDRESKNLTEYQSSPLYDIEKFLELKTAGLKENGKSAVKRHNFFKNDDYEEMTMRHLPPDHWKDCLEKINLSSSETCEKLE